METTTDIHIVGLAEMPGPMDAFIQFAGYDDTTGDLVRVCVDHGPAAAICDALMDDGIATVYAEGWQVSLLPADWPVLLPVT